MKIGNFIETETIPEITENIQFVQFQSWLEAVAARELWSSKQEEGNVFYMLWRQRETPASRQDITNPAARTGRKIENLDEFSPHRANIFYHVNQFDIPSLAVV